MNEVVIIDNEKLEIGSLVTINNGINSGLYILAAVFPNDFRHITFIKLDTGNSWSNMVAAPVGKKLPINELLEDGDNMNVLGNCKITIEKL